MCIDSGCAEKVECGVAIKDHSIAVLDAKSLMEGPANFASKPYQVKVELAVCLAETKACKDGSEARAGLRLRHVAASPAAGLGKLPLSHFNSHGAKRNIRG